MINDFEDIAGIGRCIITDDVYGDSLRRLIDEGRLTDHQYEQLLTRLPAAMGTYNKTIWHTIPYVRRPSYLRRM